MNATEKQEFSISCQILGTTHILATNLPSENLVHNHIFAIAFNGIMIIPTILLNGVAVITIFRSSQLSSKPCYFIILLQSMFDLAVGVFSIPLFIFLLANSVGGISNCLVASLARRLMLAPIGGSSIALTAMKMERYIAILHPYAYKTQVTKKRLMKYVCVTGTVEFLVIILSFAVTWLREVYFMVKIALVLLLTAYVYTRIYLVVRKLARTGNKPHDAAAEMNFTRMKLFLREIRQARPCFVLVVCFFVLGFLPATIAIKLSANVDKFQEQAIFIWAVSLAITNSSVNSVIFFWTKTMLRKNAFRMLNVKRKF